MLLSPCKSFKRWSTWPPQGVQFIITFHQPRSDIYDSLLNSLRYSFCLILSPFSHLERRFIPALQRTSCHISMARDFLQIFWSLFCFLSSPILCLDIDLLDQISSLRSSAVPENGRDFALNLCSGDVHRGDREAKPRERVENLAEKFENGRQIQRIKTWDLQVILLRYVLFRGRPLIAAVQF
jgi:hypothetical protein